MINYYDTTKKKAIDFAYGFFGVILFSIFNVIINLNIFPFTNYILNIFLIITELVASIVFTILFFKLKRKYISIGIICAYLIPLLLFGACFIIIAPQF